MYLSNMGSSMELTARFKASLSCVGALLLCFCPFESNSSIISSRDVSSRTEVSVAAVASTTLAADGSA